MGMCQGMLQCCACVFCWAEAGPCYPYVDVYIVADAKESWLRIMTTYHGMVRTGCLNYASHAGWAHSKGLTPHNARMCAEAIDLLASTWLPVCSFIKTDCMITNLFHIGSSASAVICQHVTPRC